MAVCNIFKELKTNTGSFLTFSQYVEDLTREATQSAYYHVIPSKFIAMDVNYSNFNNDTIVRTLQNEFENGCAVCRNNEGKVDGYEWIATHSTNLFWNTLFNNDLLNGDTYINEIKYVGDINLQSYNEHDGIGYSEIYCYIPNEARECKCKYVKASNKSISCESGSYIEGYTESELKGWGQISNLTYYPKDGYDFPWDNDAINIELTVNESFNINTIVVLYDVVSKTDSGNSYIYKNIPLGIYFTGTIENGVMSNSITKYCSSNDIFGAGTSYGLRICSRFSVTPNQDNIKVLDVTLENDNYSAISQVMSQMAVSQTKMDEILTKIQSNNIAEKELLAIFKNSRTNVPYLKSINGTNYWFVNGRCLGPAVSEECMCIPYEDQEILDMLNKSYNLLLELTAVNKEGRYIFDYSEDGEQDIYLDWSVIFNNKQIFPDQLFLNDEEVDRKLTGCVMKNVYNTTTYKLKAMYDGLEGNKEAKVYFVWPTFFGTLPCNSTCGAETKHDFKPTPESILELNKYTNITNKNSYTYTNVTRNNKTNHVVLAYPKDFGLLTSITDNSGYEYMEDFIVREMELTVKGQKIQYYVYVDKIPAEVYDFTLTFK